jgi:hypothetical protein
MAKSVRNCLKNGLVSPRMENAALCLARGGTYPEAAQSAGVAERTIKSWLDYAHFRQRVSELRGRLTEQALGELVSNMASACDTLAFLCRRAKSQAVRLSAARSILELGSRLRESVELEARLSALEESQRCPTTCAAG